jgi:hypothetical protein
MIGLTGSLGMNVVGEISGFEIVVVMVHMIVYVVWVETSLHVAVHTVVAVWWVVHVVRKHLH